MAHKRRAAYCLRSPSPPGPARSDNRALRGRPNTQGVEACLPSFLDLVIWGHEHESIPKPEQVRKRRRPRRQECAADMASSSEQQRPPPLPQTERKDSKTYVLQPGSTVATSLCEGEAAPKHAFLLEISVRRGGDCCTPPRAEGGARDAPLIACRA